MSTTNSSFFTKSSPSLPRRRSQLLTSPPHLLFKNGVCKQRFVLLKVKCDLEGSNRTAKSQSETTSSWSSAVVDENERAVSAYSWCASSSALTFSLFFISMKKFGMDKIQKMLGSQLCIASLVVIVLAAPYTSVAQPASLSLAATELPYVEKVVKKESSPLAISLAKHLHSIGARLYGAFWCSHCVHQKEVFGREASELLDSIECYPDGVREGTEMAEACSAVNLKYLPSWEINGELLGGEKPLKELATLSGFKLEDSSQ